MRGGYQLICLSLTVLMLIFPGYVCSFFETIAAIIALGVLGYCLERGLSRSSQYAIDRLTGSTKIMANMIAYDDLHQEQVFPIEHTQLRSGDLLLIQSGEQVPADCKILWGEAAVNESIITGESQLLNKGPKDILTGGTLLVTGTVRVQVVVAPEESVLARMIQLLKKAQGEKGPFQRLNDRISIVFIPAAGAIALLAFLLNYWFLHEMAPALMRGIAVLVIACPFAMELTNRSVLSIGLGRAVGQGILFRELACLKYYKDIQQVVFNKTGTLTTGDCTISNWGIYEAAKKTMPEETFKRIVCSLEKYSSHPIGQCIAREWKTKEDLRWTRIEEVKGLGIRGETKSGEIYRAASHKILGNRAVVLSENTPGNINPDRIHDVYITRNEEPIGWIDVTDTIRPEAEGVVRWLHAKGIRTVLLSGARLADCQQLAAKLGIKEVQADQSPEDKLAIINRLSLANPTLVTGDGIRDAQVLASATVSLSVCEASQLAVQTADIVLMNRGLTQFPSALSIGRDTFGIIRQNLYWAFIYNIIAIPVAAAGLLPPATAALVAGCSSLIPIFNSMRFTIKRKDL